MSWSLITGASSGIGEATARRLVRSGRSVWLVARRENRMAELAQDLVKAGVRVKWTALDLQDAAAVDRFAAEHSADLEQVEVLINNAGLARGVGPLQSGLADDWDEMIDTNIKGLLRITRLVLPKMVARGRGHVVNLGSVAGHWAYPGGNVYCATKAAVHLLTQGMRMDLLGSGVRVSEISPGMVETEFSEVRLRNKAKAKEVYAGMTPLSADDVAEAVAWCLERPAHVNIQEIVLYPTAQAAPGQVARHP